jgi:hypothetical protein
MQRLRLTFVLAASLCLAAVPAARAQQAAPAEYPGIETGKMWTFDVPPLDYWAKRYDFHPTQAWLDHVRLSAGSLGGCSASFVSSEGLILTNHHCSRGCIDGSTRPGEDLLTNGFYARARAEERACPGMFFDDLLGITDVTDSVSSAVPAGTPADRAAGLRSAAIVGLERRCADAADIRCQVVVMYRGGQYKLYRFRRYNDLRLVFAPEGQAAFFGGDADNFVYPRHDLDLSILRAYVNGQPAHIEHYFRWSQNGSQNGDLVFTIGVPGTTNRINTIAYLKYLRDALLPATLARYRRVLAVYAAVGGTSPQRAAALRNTVFGIANDQKRTIVYLQSLQDPQMMAHKSEWERDFRARVNANPEWRRLYGDAWDNVAVVRAELTQLDARNRYYSIGAYPRPMAGAYGSRLLNYAGLVVQAAALSAAPDSARPALFRDANRAQLERALYAGAPVDTVLEIPLLAAYLTGMKEELPATDPVLRAALAGRTPDEAARAMVQGAQILTVDQRRAVMQGGEPAVKGSADPFIALARVVEPLRAALDRRWTSLLNREVPNDERIARALLAVFGTSVAPDANSSLRISDGVVASYPYNGTDAQPYTTFFGLYDRSIGFGGRPPFDLPPRWQQRRDSLNLATPLDAVSTNDIIGGNSGSPVISKDGELIGLIFDGNMESLPWRFVFTEATGRAVWVDSRAIIEALRHVYDATALADEMTGKR